MVTCSPSRCLETGCIIPLLYFCVCVHFRANLCTEQLPSNGCLLWLHFSDFQASCNNIVAYLLHARTVTSKHVPAITQQQTKRCFLRAEPRLAPSRPSSPRLSLSDNCKRLDCAKVRRDHVTSASAVT
jgi:hypothetical protein